MATNYIKWNGIAEDGRNAENADDVSQYQGGSQPGAAFNWEWGTNPFKNPKKLKFWTKQPKLQFWRFSPNFILPIFCLVF